MALLQWPEKLRGRHVVWYVDSTAAMASFVKGSFGNPCLERLVDLFWIACFHLDALIWVEWVDSDSNWADGISRDFADDAFAIAHGFSTCRLGPDMSWWDAPLDQVWHSAAERTKKTGVGE